MPSFQRKPNNDYSTSFERDYGSKKNKQQNRIIDEWEVSSNDLQIFEEKLGAGAYAEEIWQIISAFLYATNEERDENRVVLDLAFEHRRIGVWLCPYTASFHDDNNKTPTKTTTTRKTTTTTPAPTACSKCTKSMVAIDTTSTETGPFTSEVQGKDANGCATLTFTCTSTAPGGFQAVITFNKISSVTGTPTASAELICSSTGDVWTFSSRGETEDITTISCSAVTCASNPSVCP
ncbi:unnamed protein product, partial [Mesorhabditis belari]|uniref:C6 domain-containing protein n=1 Tax=Mesorhabditis belari TaxID=2138241 RepID=A0AAF3ECN3_9BILA